jgi:hypothetical protein
LVMSQHVLVLILLVVVRVHGCWLLHQLGVEKRARPRCLPASRHAASSPWLMRLRRGIMCLRPNEKVDVVDQYMHSSIVVFLQ